MALSNLKLNKGIGTWKAKESQITALWGNRAMNLTEAIDYLSEELDLERSEHVEAVGKAVAHLRD